MIEINLIPDVKQEFLSAQRMRNTVISVSIIVCLALAGVVVLLSMIVGGQIVKNALDDRTIKAENEKLQSVEDLNNTVTIQNQLSKIGGMHEEKKINSRVFDILTVVNPSAPNDVRISNLQLDPTEQTLLIEGSAINGYTAVEVFKKTLLNTYLEYTDQGEVVKEPLTQAVNVSETSYAEDSDGRKVLRFVLSFNYPDQLFARSIENAKIVSSNSEINVTDSFIRVPESLFSERPADLNENEGGNQ